MARREICHGKVVARAAHGFAEAVVGDIAEPIEVAVNKSYGLAQLPSIERPMSVGDVGAIVQVPGIARPKSGAAERFDKGVKVSVRPERGIGLYRGSMMRRTEPTAIAGNDRRQ